MRANLDKQLFFKVIYVKIDLRFVDNTYLNSLEHSHYVTCYLSFLHFIEWEFDEVMESCTATIGDA